MKEKLFHNWKSILWGLIPIAIIAIVFALPIKTVAVENTESYWDTETVQEPYTVQEAYTDTEVYTETETKTETIFDSYLAGGKTQTFTVDKPGTTVSVYVQDYPYYYSSSPLYVVCDDYMDSCDFWPYYYYGRGQTRLNIKISYPEEVIKERAVTKYRDVTRYREVTKEVLKEKTVTDYVKVSIWKYLFMS